MTQRTGNESSRLTMATLLSAQQRSTHAPPYISHHSRHLSGCRNLHCQRVHSSSLTCYTVEHITPTCTAEFHGHPHRFRNGADLATARGRRPARRCPTASGFTCARGHHLIVDIDTRYLPQDLKLTGRCPGCCRPCQLESLRDMSRQYHERLSHNSSSPR